MALIKCPRCGNAVSDRAIECPKCGCPLQPSLHDKETVASETKRKQNALWITVSVIILALLGSGGYWWYTDKQTKSAQTEAEAKAEAAALAEKQRLAEDAEVARQDSIRQDSIWRNFTTPDLKEFELRGHVKSVIEHRLGCPWGEGYDTELVKFTKDGVWKERPTEEEFYESDGGDVQYPTYDSKGNLIKMTYPESMGEGGIHWEAVVRYSNYKFDEYGNWISRDANQTVKEYSQYGLMPNAKLTETRTIKYYNKNEKE